jgi:hypothetical protein
MILYSTNDEDFTHEDFESLLDEMLDNDVLHAGAEYFEADWRPMTAADIIGNCESILECWDECLYEEVGDTADNPFSGVPEGAKQELAALLGCWMAKHVELSQWWIFIGKSRPCVLTAEQIAAHLGEHQ